MGRERQATQCHNGQHVCRCFFHIFKGWPPSLESTVQSGTISKRILPVTVPLLSHSSQFCKTAAICSGPISVAAIPLTILDFPVPLSPINTCQPASCPSGNTILNSVTDRMFFSSTCLIYIMLLYCILKFQDTLGDAIISLKFCSKVRLFAGLACHSRYHPG